MARGWRLRCGLRPQSIVYRHAQVEETAPFALHCIPLNFAEVAHTVWSHLYLVADHVCLSRCGSQTSSLRTAEPQMHVLNFRSDSDRALLISSETAKAIASFIIPNPSLTTSKQRIDCYGLLYVLQPECESSPTGIRMDEYEAVDKQKDFRTHVH